MTQVEGTQAEGTQAESPTGNTDSAPALTGHRGFAASIAASKRLHDVIPGGAHTYARGDDQMPDDMAPVLTRGAGAHVWDMDGNCYVEYGMGLRSVTLGHGYQPVVDAVTEALRHGTNFSRATTMELEVAERFLDGVPGAEMVKFGKNGSDADDAAVRLARAVTGRDMIAMCRQPFFSTHDWFIGNTPMNAGIPSAVPSLSRWFDYNDLDSLRALFDADPGRIAAVVMEVATGTTSPEPGFLEGVRALCDENGALLVFDEIITGFRWHRGGAQTLYGVTPDLSTWGKAMGNGFPIAALAGKREFMDRGGLRTTEDRVFLLSTTFGPETSALAAANAVMDAYETEAPIEAMERAGRMLADGVNAAAAAAGVAPHVEVFGRPSCLVFATRDADMQASQPFRTLLLQELVRRGVLGQSFVISAAHTDADVQHTIDACAASFEVYGKALAAGTTDGFLVGRPVAPALRSSAVPRYDDRAPDSGRG